ncbi:MAG: RluA family pseudouridine synthase [Flavobacteriales bacterium]|jgi:23S rRNA pseudouridine1911/1915/1917 synthase|nr:RluA family pseudouridine synthase [Flavobacteriales bacterium]
MIEVLYEDNHIIAVNKKASDIIQGDKTGDKPLPEFVKDYIKKKYNKPGEVYLGVVHRLDRPVSGVVLFARTSKALSRLNEMFREKKVQKTYWAVVKNKPQNPSDTLIHFLLKNQAKNKSKAFSREGNHALRSELSYQLIKSLDKYHLIEVIPKTGRHHQIRVQLSKIGCPIKGDVKYGFDRTNKDKSIHLHARKIDFVHPVKKEPISITAPTPKDVLWNACK